MADPPPETNTGEHAEAGSGGGSKPTTPRWVKVFGIIAIVVLVVVVIGLITGQLGPGGRHGPGRHLGARGDTKSSGDQRNAAAVGGPADANDAGRRVELTTLDSMAFEPATVKVSAGETVMFVVTNTGKAVHDFTLGDAAMQKEHGEAMAHMPAGTAHDTPSSITLEPGETKELTWRIRDSGTLEFACHIPGHYEAGMCGRITVP